MNSVKLEIRVELIESCVELKSIPILKHQSMGGARDHIINIISTFLVGGVVRALDRTVDWNYSDRGLLTMSVHICEN